MDTLTKLTKAELVRLVQQRNAEVQALRLELSIARVGARTTPRASITPGHIAYREQCARARELAMTTGTAVKVTRGSAPAINSGAST